MQTAVIYSFEGHAEKRRAVLSTFAQSMSWLSFDDVADRHRYTNLSARDIELALNGLWQAGKLERTFNFYGGYWLYRVKL